MTVVPFPSPRRDPDDSSSRRDSSGQIAKVPVDRSVLLVVDEDSMMQEMIAQGFTLYDRRFEVLDARDPEMALAILERRSVHAVLTEIEFGGGAMPGRTFLDELEQRAPQVPVVLLTGADIEELRDLVKPVAIILKPPEMDYLLRKVDQIVHQSKESILRGISLESFLQVLEVERKTCTLTITSGPSIGRLYLHEGELIHAETGSLEGKEAVFAMLGWHEYSIKIRETCDAETTIQDRLNSILMEYCVQKDHGLVK